MPSHGASAQAQTRPGFALRPRSRRTVMRTTGCEACSHQRKLAKPPADSSSARNEIAHLNSASSIVSVAATIPISVTYFAPCFRSIGMFGQDLDRFST